MNVSDTHLMKIIGTVFIIVTMVTDTIDVIARSTIAMSMIVMMMDDADG